MPTLLDSNHLDPGPNCDAAESGSENLWITRTVEGEEITEIQSIEALSSCLAGSDEMQVIINCSATDATGLRLFEGAEKVCRAQ